ncbi:hypothetical protein R5W24_002788 [Gemmata sp. JC717]|uniref:hypothetical protein n=1 Tax=Gemmata algarum TaxID=2975278 RepID=UPI0021BA655D|nr:hypothetical protein [Gemmata algarum]MDY3553683.1 hypothetical protein [Gemmata algarum]
MTATTQPLPTRTVKTHLPAGAGSSKPRPLATALGLFSLGLGLTEALAPGTMARATGVRSPGLLRAYGLREMLSGLGILTNERPAFWLWSRVGGDVIDLATLAAAYADARPADRTKILTATAAVLGVTALDALCAAEHSCTHS